MCHFFSIHRFVNVLFALLGLSCVGWRILCHACFLGLKVSTFTCSEGPTLGCCVGLCNLCYTLCLYRCLSTWRLYLLLTGLLQLRTGKKNERYEYSCDRR